MLAQTLCLMFSGLEFMSKVCWFKSVDLCISGCRIMLCSCVVLYVGVVHVVLDLLRDLTCFLGMVVVLPLIKSLDYLNIFAHKKTRCIHLQINMCSEGVQGAVVQHVQLPLISFYD